MGWLARWRRRLGAQRPLDEAMEREMRQHIAWEVEERVRTGMAPDEARRSALADFGGVEHFKEVAREARPRRLLDDLSRDVRLAVRQLARRRIFALAIVVTMALGLSAATAIYSLTHAVLIRPLPYPQAEGLVLLWQQRTTSGSRPNVVSIDAYEAWSARVRSVDAVAALVPFRGTMVGAAGAERIVGVQVSPTFFDILGVATATGRHFGATDRQAIVLSDAFWRSHFGGRPEVIGSFARIDDDAFEIVGVMPRGFEPPRFGWFSDEPQFWVPFVPDEDNRRWGRFLHVLGRMAPGQQVEGVDAELKVLAQSLAEREENAGWSAAATTLDDEIRGPYRASLRLLLGGVAVLLLMGILSITHLAAAELGHFDHELSVRTALGATRLRLGRQLIVFLASVLSVGVAVAVLLIPLELSALRVLLPADVAQARVPVRWELLAATVLVMLALLAMVAVMPALRRLSQSGSMISLRSGARTARGLRGGGFIVAHVACALVIVVAAGLMVRTMQQLGQVRMGFDEGGMLAASVSLSEGRAASHDASVALIREMEQRLEALPGVRGAGVVDIRPLGGAGMATTADRSDRPLPGPGEPVTTIDVRQATRSYFASAGIPLIEGSLDGFETSGGQPRQAAINEALAKELWPGESPIGRRLLLHRDRSDTLVVTAVVGNVFLRGPRTELRGTAYAAMYDGNDVVRTFDLVIRADGPTAPLVAAVRRFVAELDPGAPLYAVRGMADAVRDVTARERFTAALLSLFAVAALVLATAGVFGVLMRDVVARERELGVRLALGATPRGILRSIVWRGLSRTLVGLAIGAAFAWGLTRTMRAILYGVSELDVLTFVATGVLLLAASLAAVLMPGVRAARTDPQGALRAESRS